MQALASLKSFGLQHKNALIQAVTSARHTHTHTLFKWWTRGQRMGARSHIPYASHHNTRAHGTADRRHTSGGERRGCVRHTDTHREERARWHTGEYGTAVPEGTRGACDVPPCRGASPHPTAPPGGAQSQPEDSRLGGGGTTPSPQEARRAHAGEGGGGSTHQGRPAPRASPTPGARGRRDGGERHLPRTARRANEHAGRSGMGVQALRSHNPSRQRLWPRRG